MLLTGVSSQAPPGVSVPRDQVEVAFGLTSHAVSHPTTSSWLQVSHRPTEIQGVEYQDPFLDWVALWKSKWMEGSCSCLWEILSSILSISTFNPVYVSE